MTRSAKIDIHEQAFKEENLSKEEIARRMKDNVPVGELLKKWTKQTVKCPSCGLQAMDQFTGGVNIEDGMTTETAFIYHCRVCELNLTEAQYIEA
jgi:hypothetical protein